jgi:hypothetical protein
MFLPPLQKQWGKSDKLMARWIIKQRRRNGRERQKNGGENYLFESSDSFLSPLRQMNQIASLPPPNW